MLKLRPLVVALLLSISFNLFPQIVSDFSSGADGWTAPNAAGGTITYSATTGNPGGAISGNDPPSAAAPIYWYFVAPPKFLGDVSTLYGRTMRFDLKQAVVQTPTQLADIILSNGTTTLYYFNISPSPATSSSWNSYSVTVDEVSGNWKTVNSSTGPPATKAQVIAVLSNLTSFQIRGRYSGTTLTTTSLDNVIFNTLSVITITSQPGGTYNNCEGTSLVLSADAIGTTNITFQWQKFNVSTGGYENLSDGGAFSGATAKNFFITDIQTVHAGDYLCLIQGDNANPVTSEVATVVVNLLPTLPITTNASNCGPGSVMVSASGAGDTEFYIWYWDAINGEPIPDENNSTFTTPNLTETTNIYVSIVNDHCETSRVAVTAIINSIPGAPPTVGNSSCVPSSLMLTASGALDGQYRWYTDQTIITPISGEVNSTFSTPILSTTTSYYVSINDGTCEGSRSPVIATISSNPNAPTTTGNSSCGPASVTLSAAGGTNGQYRWYTDPTIGNPINGEVNSTFNTPSIAATTTYFVSINNGTCESTRTPVIATITGPCNQPPVINTTSLTVQVQGSGIINLVDLLSDPDNNIDLQSLSVVVQPESGALATIDNSFNLVLDYSGVSFSGSDVLTISVCDFALACSQQEISVDVIGSITIYNALSPSIDGKNDIFYLQHIDILESTKENKVIIFNRWGDAVWETENYNNTTKVFRGLNKNGNELPTGVYYYKITFASSEKPMEGFISLKR
jgi:gliding motility-associated-like protein